jgi:hypothetical protein
VVSCKEETAESFTGLVVDKEDEKESIELSSQEVIQKK